MPAQIVTFTFPHIGNVGTNHEDLEDLNPAARHGAVGALFRAEITAPSSYRADGGLGRWLDRRGIIAMCGVDTRALTALIREKGSPNAVLAHAPDGVFDIDELKRRAASWPGLLGLDLAREVTSGQSSTWRETPWVWNEGYGEQIAPEMHVVAVDYGIKRNILRLLAGLGAKVTVVPADTGADEILAMRPDGIFLSNGPGDPAATGDYAVPVIRDLLKADIPMFGICLGHQLLALALGGRTEKMHQGHHGANHPVKDHTTGKVEIVSMNHGFAVDSGSLPEGVEETHVSLFDGSNCGIALSGRPVFSVQHHPEASPGPAGFALSVPAVCKPDPRTARRERRSPSAEDRAKRADRREKDRPARPLQEARRAPGKSGHRPRLGFCYPPRRAAENAR